MASIASINIKFIADLRGFSDGMQNTMRRMGAMGNQMKALGNQMSTFVTLPLLAAAGAAVKYASDYEESLNKVDVSFKDSAANVKQFAKTSLESFGIAEGTALDMASAYGDMGTSMGLTVGQASKMSTSLVGLAGDLASFKNISIDVANTALTGVFSGETESLKKLGIVMTEVNLKHFAMASGIKTAYEQMTQAEKVQLRYNYILSVTKNSQGDFIRTQGGAANQARIFQESLKQVAQQLGSVILPFFTKVITSVNNIIKGFGNLSEGSKGLIITIAAVAAATGPLLTVFGSMLTFVPNLITRFNALKDTLIGMQAVLLANPFTAVAVGLSALAAIVLISSSRFSALTNAERDFANINTVATDSLAKQTTELEKNLAIAKNKALSDDVRKKAVQDLNALSPQFLGNISLENLYTKQTTEAVKKYTEAMLQKAKVQAAEEKLVETQKKLLELQLGNLAAVQPSVWQNLGNAFRSAGNGAVFATLSAKTLGENLGTEYVEAQKLINKLTEFIGKNQETTTATNEVADALTGMAVASEKAIKTGTIAFYEKQIEGLQKLQKESSTSAASYFTLGNAIASIQTKIDALAVGSIEPIDLQSILPEKDMIAITGGFDAMQAQIEAKAGGIRSSLDSVKTAGEQLRASMADAALPALTDAFAQMGEGIVASLGLAETGFGGFVAGLISTITRLIAMMLASAISQSIAGAAASGTATGPAAIFTTPAFIATAVGGVLAAFAAIPKFETGGIVGGSSFYGDKILARVNSGELILNQKQQSKLNGMISSGGNSEPYVVGTKLSGSDLLIWMERANVRKNRIG